MIRWITAIALLWLFSLLTVLVGKQQGLSIGVAVCCYVFGLLLLYRFLKGEKRHNRHWKNLAGRDELTGLRNRRGLKHSYIKPPYQLILFDIDHFKAINDQHGHAVGDQVLRHFAALLEANICIRWGGDEFIVLLATHRQGAEQFTRRIVRHLEKPETKFSYSVSFGVTSVDENDNWPDSLAAADQALLAKKAKIATQS